MKEVYVINDHIITSLGFGTPENIEKLRAGTSGIRTIEDPLLHPSAIPLSRVDTGRLESYFMALYKRMNLQRDYGSFTRLEKMLFLSVGSVLDDSGLDPGDPETILILSSTKGNIDLLEDRYKGRHDHRGLFLWDIACKIRNTFGLTNPPIVVSNACISGSLAIMAAARMIRSGRYRHVIVSGGDIVSEFVISGFVSFQALSAQPCRPFDLNRTGLTLGEGVGALLLSDEIPLNGQHVMVAGGATTNDANHISGPSRTGEELALAIHRAIAESGLTTGDIGFISAHGTATPYNDEMESKAIALAQLFSVPVNSFKGYWGHTLGAAGILESVAAIHALKGEELYASAGFENLGVPEPINVIREYRKSSFSAFLKTASGFGGCNAALVFTKK